MSQEDNTFLDAGSFPKGKYFYTLQAQIGERIFSKKGIFTVVQIQKELTKLEADFESLKLLSAESGGTFNRLVDHQNSITSLAELDAKSKVFEKETIEYVINLGWLFFVILTALAVEWFFRKWLGTY